MKSQVVWPADNRPGCDMSVECKLVLSRRREWGAMKASNGQYYSSPSKPRSNGGIYELNTLMLACGLLFSLISTPHYGPIRPEARPNSTVERIRVIYYNPGRMEKTARNHMNPRFPPGDYVPTLRLTKEEMRGCLTAVNWNSRHWVEENQPLIIDFWDKVEQRWERHRCRAVDWQQKKDSTGYAQRFELDYDTAKSVNAVPSNTIARLIYPR